MLDLYRLPRGVETRWASFENPKGARGAAGRRNKGAKGAPCHNLAPGESATLLDAEGTGMVTRIWIGLEKVTPRALRSTRLDMYWDGARTPAVSAPLGDFFGLGLARMAPFESALFASPEGRSFDCFAPMPFRDGGRIVVTNESSDAANLLFYDVDYLIMDGLPEDALYFHAAWRRESPTTLGLDFTVLPTVRGAGRFVGCSVGVITDPRYGDTWWGEGEARIWLDGDRDHPTLCGTGTEDYIGTAYGQGVFSNQYQGCTVAEPGTRRWAFYRLHVPDPVFFRRDCRVALQQMGGAMKGRVAELLADKVPLIPVTVKAADGGHVCLLEENPPAPYDQRGIPGGWTNFYRTDDVSACAWFYLDRSENGLPPLADLAVRTAATEGGDEKPQAPAVLA